MFERARKFIYEQRIQELKKALKHWPDSPKREKREQELWELERKLEEVNEKLSS